MAEQLNLFGDPEPLFDARDPYNGLKHPRRPCVPALIGTGPAGETCGTCRHRVRVDHNTKVWQKCGLARPYWTHGEGSDIKAGWSACRRWERAEAAR